MTSKQNDLDTALVNKACYNVTWSTTNKIWMSDDIMLKRVPLLGLQIAYNNLASRFFHLFLSRIRAPVIISQICAGIVVSPTILGIYPEVFDFFYEAQGILAIETFTNLGIMFYVFLSGLEMNLSTIFRLKKKGAWIASASMMMPLLMGFGFIKLQRDLEDKNLPQSEKGKEWAGTLFWSLALSVTGFPVLARILAKLKLLYTRLGKDALTAAMIIDTYGWAAFITMIVFSIDGGNPWFSGLGTLLFVVFCCAVLRPILTQIIERKISNDTWRKSYVLDMFIGMFVCAYITDFLGTHPLVGAFLFGLILPHGKFSDLVMDVSDDFISGILCPTFFVGFGFRLNLRYLMMQKNSYIMLLIALLLCIPKVLAAMMVTFFFRMPARDGLAIGLLLNTKGIMAVILLNIAWDKQLISPYAFMVMMLAFIVMTTMVSPLINAIYKPKFRFMQSQLRTVQKLRYDAELRVVACVHKAHHATRIIRVLEAANATRISPMYVCALHLVELTRHGTAMLVSQMESSVSSSVGTTDSQYGVHAEFEMISNEFEEFSKEYNAVRFEASSAVSSYATIHEDIYNVAEEKRASLILLPFHKELNTEDALEMVHNEYCEINKNVLQRAPCSVGVFVDRGLVSLLETKLSIIMIFLGGPDDREALSIAWRMAGHPGTQLNVVRIHLLGKAAGKLEKSNSNEQEMLSTVIDSDMQQELDEEYIFSFRHKAVNNNDSIVYSEMEVHSNTGEEIPTLLNELDKPGYDLYIVGQGSGKNSPVFERLLEWSDNPELGVIGDIVASTSFGTRSSVLIVQQYLSGRNRTLKPPKQQINPGSASL